MNIKGILLVCCFSMTGTLLSARDGANGVPQQAATENPKGETVIGRGQEAHTLGRIVEGIKNVTPLSVFRSRRFAENYGLRLMDGPLEGLMARAVIVIDAKGIVRYTELVSDISKEPDCNAALKAMKSISPSPGDALTH